MAYNQISDALVALYNRVKEEMEKSLAFAREHDISTMANRAQADREWLETYRKRDFPDLERMAENSEKFRAYLIDAVEATIGLADGIYQATEGKPERERRERLLRWAEAAIPTVVNAAAKVAQDIDNRV